MPAEFVLDQERCRIALRAGDTRLAGWVYVATAATGRYCRAGCPECDPGRPGVVFLPSPGAAGAAGFRACQRCRPDRAPDSPRWAGAGDLAARAMRLIADGAVERVGVAGLAAALHSPATQVDAALRRHAGADAVTLAGVHRAHLARELLECSDLEPAALARAAGYTDPDEPERTVAALCSTDPFRGRPPRGPLSPREVLLRLPVRRPFDWPGLVAFLGARAVPGIEEVLPGGITGSDGAAVYRRTVRLPRGAGVLTLAMAADHVMCTARLEDLRDLAAAVRRCRVLLDLDADPRAIARRLGADPALADLVRAGPGRRRPGAADPTELATRAVLGQQVSVAGARTLAGRIVAALGDRLPQPEGSVTHVFPTAATLRAAGPGVLRMPASRRQTVTGLAAALDDGRVQLHAGVDRDEAERALLAVPGIGPWTASYIRMRCLGDPDVFLPTDLGVVKALRRFGLGAPDAQRWRPWRSYAVLHLWASLGAAGGGDRRFPPGGPQPVAARNCQTRPAS